MGETRDIEGRFPMQTMLEDHFRKCAPAAPDRILVATDMMDTEYLVPHAIAQAKACGAQVTLLHALSPANVSPMDGSVIPYVDKAKIVRDARVMLLSVAREFEAQGVSCDTAVRDGIPSEVISEELSKTNATRLIMGSHGRGKLGQLALGSIAHQLIINANVPVFVVGPHARTAGQHCAPRKILHPVSLAGDYRNSLHLALDIAQAYRAELTLLHVLDPNPNPSMDPERTLEWANNALRALIPDGTKLVPPVHIKVRSGKLAEEILKAAEEGETDWIVLGADGAIGVWPFNEGAAYKVLTSAKCPVLALRHEPVRSRPAKHLEEVHFTSPL